MEDISSNNLDQIKKLDVNYFCWYLKYKNNNICINSDVILHIIFYLRIKDILKLSQTSKMFYGLCYSNYVWGPRLFNQYDNPPETTLEIIYDHNREYFLSYYYFKNYVKIDYKLNGNPNGYNYLELFKNIMTLASDLRAPYFHKEIIPDIRRLCIEMNQSGIKYEEFIYSVKSVETISLDTTKEYIWKFQETTNECEILMTLKKSKNNQIKFKKLIHPLLVPTNVIEKIKVIFYIETINRLFQVPSNELL